MWLLDQLLAYCRLKHPINVTIVTSEAVADAETDPPIVTSCTDNTDHVIQNYFVMRSPDVLSSLTCRMNIDDRQRILCSRILHATCAQLKKEEASHALQSDFICLACVWIGLKFDDDNFAQLRAHHFLPYMTHGATHGERCMSLLMDAEVFVLECLEWNVMHHLH